MMHHFLNIYNAEEGSEEFLHFEFETIHPFVDGNGRTGRLIYAMDQIRRGRIPTPILDKFRTRGEDFYETRSRYYQAISNHKHSR